MAEYPAMPFYCDSYLTDTACLDLEERGLYSTLLFHMWLNEGILQYDDKILSRMCGVTPLKFRKNFEKISSFFEKNGDYFSQKRLKNEYEKCQNKSKKQSENIKKRWEKIKENNENKSELSLKNNKTDDTNVYTKQYTKPIPNTIPTEYQVPYQTDTKHYTKGHTKPIPTISISKSNTNNLGGDIITARGERNPPPESPPPEFINFFSEKYKGGEAAAKELYGLFKNHYLADIAAIKTEKQWLVTWQSWCSREAGWGRLVKLPAPDSRTEGEKQLEKYKMAAVAVVLGIGCTPEMEKIYEEFIKKYGEPVHDRRSILTVPRTERVSTVRDAVGAVFNQKTIN